MWHLSHFVVRPAEALLGVFCLATALLLYPNEEGRIQSAFEDAWLRVNDYQQLALSRHTAFLRQVAALESRFLDIVFGHKLFSAQSIVLSCTLSLTPWLLLVFPFGSEDLELKSALPVISVHLPLVIMGVAFIWIRNKITRRCIVTLATIGGMLAFRATVFDVVNGELASTVAEFYTTTLVIAMFGGLVCDILFIIVTRRLIRWAGEMMQFSKVLAILVANILLAAVLVGYAWYHFYYHGDDIDQLRQNLAIVSATNIFDAFLALLFVLLAALLLIHRGIWPLLNRTLFKMQDIGIKGRRAILTAFGMALLSASVFGDKVPDLFKEIVKALGG